MSRGFCRYLDTYYDYDHDHNISLNNLREDFNAKMDSLGGASVSKRKLIKWIKNHCLHLTLDETEELIYGLKLKTSSRKRIQSDVSNSASPTSRTEDIIYPNYRQTDPSIVKVSPLAVIDYTYMPIQENGQPLGEKLREWYDSEFNRLSQLKNDYAENSVQSSMVQELLVQLSRYEPRPQRQAQTIMPNLSALLNNSVFEDLLNRIIPIDVDNLEEEFDDIEDEIIEQEQSEVPAN